MNRLVAMIALLLAAGAFGCSALPDSRPETLSEERRILEAREAVAFASAHPEGKGRLGTGIILIRAEPEEVWDLLTDYARYQDFFPRTDRSMEVIRHDSEIRVALDFDSLLTYDFWVILKMEEDKSREAYTIRWSRIDGPMKTLGGYWKIERYGSGTKLTFHSHVEIERWVPEWVWNLVESKFLPLLMENVRNTLE